MSTGLLGGIIFVVVFAGIILVHEIGHFTMARLMRIDVEEFGIGIPPRLIRLWRNRGSLIIGNQKVIIPLNKDLPFDHTKAVPRQVEATADEVRGKLILRSIKFSTSQDDQVSKDDSNTPAPENKGTSFNEDMGAVRLNGRLNEINLGTEFTLNWIPLGGFNRIKGEDNPDLPHGMAAAHPFKRILVLLAGAAMNLLTAVFVYMVLFSQMGIPDPNRVIVRAVLAGTPAEAAGFKAGDIILEIDTQGMGSIDQVINTINAAPEKQIIITVQGPDGTRNLPVTPETSETDGRGRIGVMLSNPYRPVRTIWETIPLSFQATYGFAEQLLAMPGRFLAGTLSPEEAQLGGPRTIWNLFQQAVARDTESREAPSTSTGIVTPSYYTLLLIISLTISVGVLNLMPLPALDGGRILMTLIEIVIRRRIPAKFQIAINSVGFILLIALLGIFYIKDIISPVAITLP